MKESLESLEEDNKHLDHLIEECRAQLHAAQEEHSQAQLESKAWIARADALSLALEESRERSGIETVSEDQGVLGAFHDLIEIDYGWESAFNAAIGNASSSVVVRDTQIAKQSLQRSDLLENPAELLSPQMVRKTSQAPRSPLRDHVRSSSPKLNLYLTDVLANVRVVEDWETAVTDAIQNPHTTLVTLDGDYFDGVYWRVGQPSTGATGKALEEAIKILNKSLPKSNDLRMNWTSVSESLIQKSRTWTLLRNGSKKLPVTFKK